MSRAFHQDNPNLSLNEAQPNEIALGTTSDATSTPPGYVHRDVYGNYLDEAHRDRSNPTRNRYERPLDTIRSFERAASHDPACTFSPPLLSSNDRQTAASGPGRSDGWFGGPADARAQEPSRRPL